MNLQPYSLFKLVELHQEEKLPFQEQLVQSILAHTHSSRPYCIYVSVLYFVSPSCIDLIQLRSSNIYHSQNSYVQTELRAKYSRRPPHKHFTQDNWPYNCVMITYMTHCHYDTECYQGFTVTHESKSLEELVKPDSRLNAVCERTQKKIGHYLLHTWSHHKVRGDLANETERRTTALLYSLSIFWLSTKALLTLWLVLVKGHLVSLWALPDHRYTHDGRLQQ